jgi:hypothetical protein
LSNYSQLITIAVFFAILITLFLLSRKFRMFVYGLIIWAGIGILYGIYVFSRYIGNSAGEGNTEPLKWIAKVIGFIVSSIFFGWIMLKFPKIREFDEVMKRK